jgi:glucan endo-1,3-alpha-glucosidase
MNRDKLYMSAVSPWFYTHYGPNTYNKNVRNSLFIVYLSCANLHQWIYLADYHLYPTRWENLISSRDKIDIVEIVTWNDYGESHYIGPIEGAQPNSQTWVNGFDHTGTCNM